MKRWECRNHPGRFVTPCKQKLGYHIGCAGCTSDSQKNSKNRKRRAEKFDRLAYTKDFIACIRHSDRLCQRSYYIRIGARRCGGCRSHLSSGKVRPGNARSIRRYKYNNMMIARKFYGSRRRMNAMQVFERSTGFNLELAGFSRKDINGKNNRTGS